MPTGTLRHEDLFPVCPETWVAIDTAVKFGHSFFRSNWQNAQNYPSATRCHNFFGCPQYPAPVPKTTKNSEL